MDQAISLSREAVTVAILGLLAGYALTPEEVAGLKRRPAGADKGLIAIEPDGARANLEAFWWTLEYPYLVIAILSFLGVSLLNRDEVIAWIKERQHPLGYFPNDKTGRTVREATYYACAMLSLLGAGQDRSGWARPKLTALLQAQQQPDQRRHFEFLPKDLKGFYAELEVAFCAISSLVALGETVSDPPAAIHYLQKKQEKSGTFKIGWVKQRSYSEENAVFDAVRSLILLGSEPLEPQACARAIRQWQMTDGGFNAIGSRYPESGPAVSQLYTTALAVLTLHLLGSAPVDRQACLQKMLSLWVPSGGYFLNHPNDAFLPKTLLITYLGLLATAVLGGIQIDSDLLYLVLYSPCS
ncbi:MAG: terpene cyclase/mutase family protein [Chloroflexi bacterium]|nr:terpene cyclase/mutase family protein [Chloroflexota bacterium]MCI0731836.1 terpene cyclase/mutase family protein [Chloroflexota bacterium]